LNLLLAFLITMVVVGLLSNNLSKRAYAVILGVSVLTVVLYYLPQRFMT
jgi:hypothetical protein